MSDVYYRLTSQDGDVFADHVQTGPSEINNRTRGDRATFDLHITQETLTVASGETKTISSGNTETYRNVTVQSNGEIIVESDANLFANEFIDVKQNGSIDVKQNGTKEVASGNGFTGLLNFDRHAGSYTLNDTLNNTQRYNELLPSNPNKQSLVVGLEPSDTLSNENITGKWGLVRNVTDNRTTALTNDVITVEIDILADFGEYSSPTDVENNLAI